MEELVKSFKNKIVSRGQRGTVPNSLPTIFSKTNTHTDGMQHHHYQRPRYVSIGPLNARDPNLQKMEDHKWWLMHKSGFGSLNFDLLSICFLGLRNLEQRTRETYSVIIDMASDDFLQILFLDAYFIILRVVAEEEKKQNQRVDERFHYPQPSAQSNLLADGEEWSVEGDISQVDREEYVAETLVQTNFLLAIEIRNLVTRNQFFNFDELTLKEIDIDLITLDNQIPFFVVEYIWKWLMESVRMQSSLELVQYFSTFFHVPSNWSIPEKIHHVLHFLHCSIISQTSDKCKKYDGRKQWIPSATELKKAGIEFKLNESPSSFLDIKFQDGVVHIPKIFITERQRLRLQNLVDFEQSVPGVITYFTNFVRFMSCLLSKEKDVRIVSLQGIIESRLGSDKEVQQFFQNLQQRCSYWHAATFLDDVFIGINNYQQSRKKRWKAILRRKYCSNPWVTLSVLAAIVLFVLTFLQTFYTVCSFYHHRS